MGKDHIDASLGLAFSLKLFEQYRKNGMLQAELHHVPGIRGRCKGFLHLVEGKVVSCYVEDKDGQRHNMSKDTLSRLDTDRGPFEWSLTQLPSPPSPTTREMPAHPEPNSPIPKVVGPLEMEKLDGWTDKHKLMLSMVYEAINGKRNIEEIKYSTPLPANVTEEALRILLALKVIIIA